MVPVLTRAMVVLPGAEPLALLFRIWMTFAKLFAGPVALGPLFAMRALKVTLSPAMAAVAGEVGVTEGRVPSSGMRSGMGFAVTEVQAKDLVSPAEERVREALLVPVVAYSTMVSAVERVDAVTVPEPEGPSVPLQE